MHSHCSCISKRNLIEWLILQVTDVWNKSIAKIVRNNVILSITAKAGLLLLCLYRFSWAAMISHSLLKNWSQFSISEHLCMPKLITAKQYPSSLFIPVGMHVKSCMLSDKGREELKKHVPLLGLSIPLPVHVGLEAKVNNPLLFSILFPLLIFQVDPVLLSPLKAVKEPVSWGGSSGWRELLFKTKLFIWEPEVHWRPAEWHPWHWACM